MDIQGTDAGGCCIERGGDGARARAIRARLCLSTQACGRIDRRGWDATTKGAVNTVQGQSDGQQREIYDNGRRDFQNLAEAYGACAGREGGRGDELMRWLIWAPLCVMALGAGAYGLRLGYLAMTITETDVINHYAELYGEQTGGKMTDCVAFPGDAEIWLVVACGPLCAPTRREYHVNRVGWLVQQGDTSCPEARLGWAWG